MWLGPQAQLKPAASTSGQFSAASSRTRPVVAAGANSPSWDTAKETYTAAAGDPLPDQPSAGRTSSKEASVSKRNSRAPSSRNRSATAR